MLLARISELVLIDPMKGWEGGKKGEEGKGGGGKVGRERVWERGEEVREVMREGGIKGIASRILNLTNLRC